MKVLTVSADYLPNLGGVAAHVHGLTQHLAGLGHEVVVVKSDWGRKPNEIRRIGDVEAHYLYLGRPIRKLGVALRILRAARYIARLHRRRRFDVLHWHNLYVSGLETKWVCRDIPRVFSHHTSMFVRDFQARRLRKLRFYCGHADWIVASCRDRADMCRFLVPGPRIECIPDGVDAERFSRSRGGPEVRARFGIPPEAPLLVAVSRLEPVKGVLYLARAAPRIFEAVPQARLLIVGDGSERDAIREVLTHPACRDRVIMAGALPNDEVPPILAVSDIAVVPSLMEATSITALEAMSCGCAIVGTRVGGIPETFDANINGLLVAPEDPKALADAVISLLTEPKRLELFKAESRKIVLERFTWRRIAERTVEVYERARARFASGS